MGDPGGRPPDDFGPGRPPFVPMPPGPVSLNYYCHVQMSYAAFTDRSSSTSI
jgi:hypothetical protein